MLKITADDVNLSLCWCIDTQSYGKEAIYPKRASYHGVIILSKTFIDVLIDYNSTSHIVTKVFGIQSTDTHGLIWIFNYTYLTFIHTN